MDNQFKIYTKTGDDGTSGLIGGTRVEKSDKRLEAYGTVDELNSWIGLIATQPIEQEVSQTLQFIQRKLFVIGSHLATDTTKSDLHQKLVCKEEDVTILENEIDRMQDLLPPLKHFILPGGSAHASHAHLARTVCRRAERRIAVLNQDIELQNAIIVFINRLSDYLFALARYINNKKGITETIWESKKS